MEYKKENILGMELDVWRHESCYAEFGVNEPAGWATLYSIESAERNKGHAQELLKEAKQYYKGHGLRFGGSVALNRTMRHIYKKLNIKEYRGGR